MKEAGQTAHDAHWRGSAQGVLEDMWARLRQYEKDEWANVEAAVLAAAKPERAGTWITDINTGGRRFIIVDRAVEQVTCPSSKDLMARHWVCFEGGASIAVSAADARKVVEALGGTWPEETVTT
jgi:hypothetical protein